MKLGIRLCVCVLVAMLARAEATEYFVRADGSDANDGLTRETAFATVQKGVDALEAGDTLTIGPGEYQEAVSRANLGSMDAETVIRAEIPGTAVLRGDVRVSGFRKLDGYRFVYVADFDHDGEGQVVNELDTLTVFLGRPNTSEVEFEHATFHHDRDAGKLYISTSDNQPPDAHRYTVSVLGGNGLHLTSPERVVVEGLAATGFNISGFVRGHFGNGIILEDARECVIRDCQAWLNGWGIQVGSEAEGVGHNVIERCVAWGNDSPFGNDRRGGISGFRHRGDIIRDSVAFLNGNCGIYLRIDSDPEIASRLENNIAWGNRWNFIIKGNPNGVNISERNVEGASATGPDAGRINPIHNLLLSGNPGGQDAPGTISVEEEGELDVHREFADPDNRDYRLQATSRFRGTGPDGSDRGPFPYEANIFFVRPDGDDSADGLSLEAAWRTVARGVRDLRPGDTLYIAPGAYREDVRARLAGEEGRPVSIRGRGLDPVVLAGDVQLADSRNVEFKRLRFEGTVSARDSRGLAFDQCEFAHLGASLAANAVSGIKVTHCSFTAFQRTAIALRDSEGAHLSGNLYDNRNGAAVVADSASAIRYSDYNAYRNPAAALQVGGNARGIADVPHDAYSESLPTGFAPAPGPFNLHNRPGFAAAGPMGQPFGPYRAEPRREKLRFTSEPVVHSVSATTANIEWMTILPSRVELAWGETPEMENSEMYEAGYFGTYSLAALEPGKTYYFQIKALNESERVLGQHEVTRLGTIETLPAKLDGEPLSFTTAHEDPEPQVYYVAPDGDNGNTGLDRQNAWRTIQHAAGQVSVGDTVLIAGGDYEEQVRVRVTGAEGAPITFRSIPGEKVVLNAGPAELNDAFAVNAKHHLRFDGMYLLSMWFNLYRATDIEISRMFAGRYSSGYAPGFVNALLCRDLTVTNSVALSAKGGPQFFGCADVRIENNVFYRNMIGQLLIEPMPGDRTIVANNIFTDGLQGKGNAPMFYLGRYDAFEERNNCYYPRPDRWHEKPIAMLYSDFAFDRSRLARNMGEVQHPHPQVDQILRLSLTEMQEYLGETDSVLANPRFAGVADMPDRTEDGTPVFAADRMTGTGPTSIHNFFATNPEIVERGIGLQPEAFEDFHFNKGND